MAETSHSFEFAVLPGLKLLGLCEEITFAGLRERFFEDVTVV